MLKARLCDRSVGEEIGVQEEVAIHYRPSSTVWVSTVCQNLQAVQCGTVVFLQE